jgi:adenylate cyclase
VAAAELFCMAMFYPVGNADPPPDLYYHSARSLIVLIGGMLAAQLDPDRA